MAAIEGSPLPLKHVRDHRGRGRLKLATGGLPARLSPQEARQLAGALQEWATRAESSPPPPPGWSWKGSAAARARGRRGELVVGSFLVASILLGLSFLAFSVTTREAETTLSFTYAVVGPSAQDWNVTPCRSGPTQVQGGDTAWFCSMVLWNAVPANGSISAISISNGHLSTTVDLPQTVLAFNFEPITVVGQTPQFGGSQNVQITITVGVEGPLPPWMQGASSAIEG